MKVAYFDCFSGISGDMCLAALIDAGVPIEYIVETLRGLHIDGYEVSAKKVKRAGIEATMVEVKAAREGIIRRYRDVLDLISSSELEGRIRETSLRIFKRIFEAEAKVHGKDIEEVHLHELSATDCIVDIVGTVSGLMYLKVERVLSSPVNLGSGMVKTDHGMLPVPAPATIELLRGVPVYGDDSGVELTTPTGAAIISTLAEGFLPVPELIPKGIGYGAGSRELKGKVNALRVLIGEDVHNEQATMVVEINTNIDDMNPQVYGYLMERLYEEGALEVFFTPVYMKKNRPGTMLTVLCWPDDKDKIKNIIFSETTTIGLRYSLVLRSCLKREVITYDTEYGKVRFKVSEFNGQRVAVPEYEDCKRIARERNEPILRVIEQLKRIAEKDIRT